MKLLRKIGEVLRKIDWGVIGISILGAMAIVSFVMIFVCIFVW